jgi:hypothetical protein
MTHALARRLNWLEAAGLAAPAAPPGGGRSDAPDTDDPLCLELTFPRSVRSDQVVAFWSGLGAALSIGHGFFARPWLVAETVAEAGRVRHFLHAPAELISVVEQQLSSQLPGVRWQYTSVPLLRIAEAVELRLTARERSLRVDRAPDVSTPVLMALAAAGRQESAVLQWVFAGTTAARVVHRSTADTPALGEGSEVRREIGDVAGEVRSKSQEPLLLGTCRIGVTATSSLRRRLLVRGVLGALRGSDAPGVRTVVRVLPGTCHRSRMRRRAVPTAFRNTFNGAELAARVPFPIEGPQVPGLTLGGSRLLVPAEAISSDPTEGAVLAMTTFPGVELPIVLRDVDRTAHCLMLGATGVGKSTTLARLALSDIARGHAVIVIDPRGDLVDDIADRLPADRIKDVIILDPGDRSRPVGFNPLAAYGRNFDLVSDSITSVFHGLFSQYWGPRSDDTLRCSVLSLSLGERDSDDVFTLCEVLPLLVDKVFRRSVTATLSDPVVLEPFWAMYESMRAAERTQVISPLANKLRALVGRQHLRSVFAQSEPKWSVEQVMADRKILLVPLRAGVIGEEAAQLLGSLLIARIWNATLSRAAIPREQRHPVMCFVDEYHTLLNIPTSFADLTAQARGHGVSLTLAGQHLGQISSELRRDVLVNARNKVIFQQSIEDSRLLARGFPELDPEDLQGLPSREVVISLVSNAQVQPAVSGRTLPLGPSLGTAALAREHSSRTYGVDAQEVEAALLKRRGLGTTARAGGRRKRVVRPPLQIGDVREEDES